MTDIPWSHTVSHNAPSVLSAACYHSSEQPHSISTWTNWSVKMWILNYTLRLASFCLVHFPCHWIPSQTLLYCNIKLFIWNILCVCVQVAAGCQSLACINCICVVGLDETGASFRVLTTWCASISTLSEVSSVHKSSPTWRHADFAHVQLAITAKWSDSQKDGNYFHSWTNLYWTVFTTCWYTLVINLAR